MDVSELETNAAVEEPQHTDDFMPPAREGLPPGYRMRADRHYVDELTSAEQRRPPLMDSEEAIGSEGQIDLFKSLSETLTAIESARRLLEGNGTAIARRTALDLIEVHTARAAWLIEATRFLESEEPRPDRRQPIGTLIDDLVERFAPECRLRGVTLRARVDDRAYSTRFDARALSIGLTGAIVALLPLVEIEDEPTLNVSGSRSNESLIVEVAYRSTTLDATSGERLVDGTWTLRPGGWPAALGVRALKRAVEHHDGNIGFDNRRGEARLRLTFPQDSL